VGVSGLRGRGIPVLMYTVPQYGQITRPVSSGVPSGPPQLSQ